MSLIDKIYQKVRTFTIKRKVKLLNSFKLPGKNLLDIGTGTGDFLLACFENEWNTTGIEPNIKARTIANNKLNSDQTIYKSLNELLKSNSSLKKFDVISMWHVLEHVPDLNEYINHLYKLLEPNGILLIAVPNHNCFDARYYKNYWAAYDVPRHLWHFSRLSIKNLFDQSNMTVTQTYPMLFDSFYVSLLSEKYKKGYSNFLVAFIIGLVSNIKAFFTNEYSSLIYVIKKS
jgi:2-polyprenyl-3-methyl-5-hydroxy-6-metoxy-1,4-benzoquinol methylase